MLKIVQNSNLGKFTLGIATCCLLSLASCEKKQDIEPSVSDLVNDVEDSYADGKKVETLWDGVALKIGTRASDEVIAAINAKADIAYNEFMKRFRVSAYLFDGYGIGVVPEANACPSWSEKLDIYMDNEDHNTQSSQTGWHGSFDLTNKGNSWLHFCKVDSRVVRNPRHKYSVLQFGPFLDPEYEALTRVYIDNENGGNTNEYSGDMGPNESSQSGTSTTLFFASNVDIRSYVLAPQFASLGFSYGVFSYDAYNGLPTGYHWADDEDNSNASTMTNIGGTSVIEDTGIGYRIPGVWTILNTNTLNVNTRFDLAKVQ